MAAPSVSPWVSSRNPSKKLLSNPDPLHPAKAFVSCAMQNTIAVEGLGLPGMVQATMPPALGQPERRWTFRALLPNCVGLLPVRVILGITSPLGVGAFLRPFVLKKETQSLYVFPKNFESAPRGVMPRIAKHSPPCRRPPRWRICSSLVFASKKIKRPSPSGGAAEGFLP